MRDLVGIRLVWEEHRHVIGGGFVDEDKHFVSVLPKKVVSRERRLKIKKYGLMATLYSTIPQNISCS